MAGTSITITIDDTPLRNALDALRSMDATAMRPALDAIGAAMVTATQLRFRSGADPDGAEWKPSKRALKHGGQTLVESGRLLQSLTYNVLDDGVEWGSNVIYAAIHQFGGPIHRAAGKTKVYRTVSKSGELGNRFVKKHVANFMTEHSHGAYDIVMPRRAYLGVNEADAGEITQILSDHLQAAIDGGAG